MNLLRCTGLLLLGLLSACDAEKQPASPPKAAVEVPAVTKVAAVAPRDSVPVEQTSLVPAQVPAAAPVEPMHALTPNVPVVKVTAESKSVPASKPASVGKAAMAEQKAQASNAKSAKIKADNAEIASRPPVASKSKAPAQVVKDTHLPKAALDLSLPPDMVKQLTPPANVITGTSRSKPRAAGAKPLLPAMFPETQGDPDFQLNGRLLSNEMQLQLRNESRHEVEGAAVDFTFKQ